MHSEYRSGKLIVGSHVYFKQYFDVLYENSIFKLYAELQIVGRSGCHKAYHNELKPERYFSYNITLAPKCITT